MGLIILLLGILIGFLGGIILYYFDPSRFNPFVESLVNIFKKKEKKDVEDAEFTVEEEPKKKTTKTTEKQ